jgi:hypothetical protein
MRLRSKVLLGVVASALVLSGAVSTTASAADASPCQAGVVCPDDNDQPSGDTTTLSDGTKQTSYRSPTKSCSVYANGGGMGMSCVTVGGAGASKSLRERFGDQKLQRCRYSEIPSTIQTPENLRPAEGRYMLMSCLGNIDFDTYSGGRERTLELSVVFVRNGTDIADRHNGITDFLWDQFSDGQQKQLPVPFMRTRPNTTPIVGVPTYFTFRWLDPITKAVVAEGPYADKADGGPFRQLDLGDVVMQARATSVTIDPNQQGIPPVKCTPSTPYREGVTPKNQRPDACSITFPRSSASARKLATKPIPDNVDDAFYADVTVSWQVTYGDGATMNDLGTGFTMRIRQVVPVQEVQAPNQPPAVIY